MNLFWGSYAKTSICYAALLRFATDSETCRRESLMRLLGAEPDTCFGCDVCRKAIVKMSPWEAAILKLLGNNKRVLSPATAVKMLHTKHPALSEHDAAELIDSLLISGTIKKIQWGPWKEKFSTIRKKTDLLFS